MPTAQDIKEFFVRGREVILPDSTAGIFLEFTKTTAIVLRDKGLGKKDSVTKTDLINRNLRDW